MQQELRFFQIGSAIGGNQEWFRDRMMYLGGCAAVTACDVCLYLALYQGRESLYPFDRQHVTKEDYLRFGKIMKPYLHPRVCGIDELGIYMEGLSSYCLDHGETSIAMSGFDGTRPIEEAKEIVRAQMEAELPIPYLMLRHKEPRFKDISWHWFLVAGYQEWEDRFLIKVITYGEVCWIDFNELWHTGHRRKGGMILLHLNEAE